MIPDTSVKSAQVFRETRRLAESGQPKAQYNLGLMYANGVGVQQDFKLAMHWYRKAAENSFPAAQYILAGKYAAGQGVDRDIRQALYWYLQASDRGSSKALFKLGQMLSVPQEEFANQCFEQAAEKGIVEAQLVVGARCSSAGGEKQGQATAWLQKAAENGVPEAQYITGTLYESGKGVEQSIEQALAWYRKSARQGFAPAQLQLGMLYSAGELIPKDNRQAVSWLGRAAEQGNREAQSQLGLMYELGVGLVADQVIAETWYRKAADQGDMKAQIRLARLCECNRPALAIEMYQRAAAQGSGEAYLALGKMYAEGLEIARDLNKALSFYFSASQMGELAALVPLAQLLDREGLEISSLWYHQAAEAGDANARFVLANRLALGQGVEKNTDLALEWYLLAAEQGLPEAQYAVSKALMARAESGVESSDDVAETVAWCRKAAKQGFAQAQRSLGLFYFQGFGVSKDNRQAASWWLKAAEQGDSEAQVYLGQLFEKGAGRIAEKHAEQWYRRALEGANDPQAVVSLLTLLAKNKAADSLAWFRRLAEDGHAAAQFQFAQALQADKGDLDTESLVWLLKAAAQGNLDSYQELAHWACDNPALLASNFAKLGGLERGAGANPVPSVSDTGQGFSELLKKAQAGDPRAQWSLGKIFAVGQAGMEKDKSAALDWYRKSAQAGFPAAQAALAIMLSTGQGGLSDSKEAIYWWEKSAKQGDLESQYNLALMYEKGEVVVCDYKLAAYWLEKAARQGLATAQIRLGLAHATGKLGTPDYVEAYAWFALAMGGGSEIAQANLEHAKSLMTASQITQAKLRAESLFKEIR